MGNDSNTAENVPDFKSDVQNEPGRTPINTPMEQEIQGVSTDSKSSNQFFDNIFQHPIILSLNDKVAMVGDYMKDFTLKDIPQAQDWTRQACIVKIAFLGVLTYMLVSLYSELGKSEKSEPTSDSDEGENEDKNDSTLESDSEDESHSETFSDVDNELNRRVEQQYWKDETCSFTGEPDEIVGEYTLDRVENGDEFLRVLGYSLIERKLILTVPTRLKVEYEDGVWQFTTINPLREDAVERFTIGQKFTINTNFNTYDCLRTKKGQVFAYMNKSRCERWKTTYGVRCFTATGMIQSNKAREGNRVYQSITYFNKL